MSSSKQKEMEQSTNSSNQQMPLFFSNPQVISLERHARAKLLKGLTMEFARRTNSIPLTAADIAEAAMCYPIVFAGDDEMVPMAVVGLEHENYFIDDDGKWKAGYYVPSYVRKYPFVFTANPESDQLTLCIDEVVLDVEGTTEGSAIYDGTTPSAFVNNALEFCAAYQEQYQFTRALSQSLKQLGLLYQRQSNIQLGSGRELLLDGFHAIDPEKLKTLNEQQVFEGYQQGRLAAIYYILQSQSNWRRLLEMGSAREAQAA